MEMLHSFHNKINFIITYIQYIKAFINHIIYFIIIQISEHWGVNFLSLSLFV